MFEWPIRRAKWFLSFIFSGVACLPRKHLYPMGPKSYPTLAQKHLNGAVSWNNIVSTCYKQVLSINILFLVVFHDSGAWTQGSCCACKVATNCHSGSSCCKPSQWACWVALTDIWKFLVWMLRDVPRFVFFGVNYHCPRIRASLFVNLVAMREFMSSKSNGVVTMSAANLHGLRRANYLFHAALNSYLTYKACWTYIACPGMMVVECWIF